MPRHPKNDAPRARHRTPLTPYAALLIICTLSSGCVNLTASNDEFDRRRFFGFVQLTEPATGDRIQARKVQVLGLSFDDGVALGWMDAERVVVPATDETGERSCGLVVIVRSREEARHARTVLEELEGTGLCIADFNEP